MTRAEWDGLCSRARNIASVFIVATIILWMLLIVVYGKDDGRWKDSPLRPWFEQLASKKGLCCAFADGRAIQDVDWDVKDGHYRVRLDDQWIDVPEAALVTQSNWLGMSVVWPYRDADGQMQIRCFMPGSGS